VLLFSALLYYPQRKLPAVSNIATVRKLLRADAQAIIAEQMVIKMAYLVKMFAARIIRLIKSKRRLIVLNNVALQILRINIS
jgi:hypothetical protein